MRRVWLLLVCCLCVAGSVLALPAPGSGKAATDGRSSSIANENVTTASTKLNGTTSVAKNTKPESNATDGNKTSESSTKDSKGNETEKVDPKLSANSSVSENGEEVPQNTSVRRTTEDDQKSSAGQNDGKVTEANNQASTAKVASIAPATQEGNVASGAQQSKASAGGDSEQSNKTKSNQSGTSRPGSGDGKTTLSKAITLGPPSGETNAVPDAVKKPDSANASGAAQGGDIKAQQGGTKATEKEEANVTQEEEEKTKPPQEEGKTKPPQEEEGKTKPPQEEEEEEELTKPPQGEEEEEEEENTGPPQVEEEENTEPPQGEEEEGKTKPPQGEGKLTKPPQGEEKEEPEEDETEPPVLNSAFSGNFGKSSMDGTNDADASYAPGDEDYEVDSKDPYGRSGLGGGSSKAEIHNPQQFTDDADSHFFAYFLTIMVTAIIFYLVFHNKQRIIALIIEGRAPRNGRTRRSSSRAKYHKLDNNLEEAITATKGTKYDRVY